MYIEIPPHLSNASRCIKALDAFIPENETVDKKHANDRSPTVALSRG